MNYPLITNKQWRKLNKTQKIVAIQSILNSWKENYKNSRYDAQWFFEAVESSIVDSDGMDLGKRMSMLAVMSNAFGDKDEIINKLVSQLTDEEKQRYLYIEEKVKEYKKENNQEYISDSAFIETVNKSAEHFNISKEEIMGSWEKMDKARNGIE